MTCMRTGKRWMLDVEHFGSLPSLLPAPTLPSLPLPLFLHVCDQVVVFLSHVPPLHCLYPGSSTLCLWPSLPIPSSHALHTHARVFTEQLFCHHATWDPVKPTSGERWTSGCCLVPTHVYPDFGAKTLCDFTLDAKAFCSACHNQFMHYYKVKHQSPTSKGFLLAVSLHFTSVCVSSDFLLWHSITEEKTCIQCC